VVDELGGDFWQSAPVLNPSAVGCGFGRHAYWAPSTTDAAANPLPKSPRPNRLQIRSTRFEPGR